MILDPRLEADSIFIKDLKLSTMRLHKNAAFPWIMLIPKRENIFEIIDLSLSDQQLLIEEICATAQMVREIFKPDKMNIASLGNIVPQLHIHIIARYTKDKAWPNPVWNSGIYEDYSNDTIKDLILLINNYTYK